MAHSLRILRNSWFRMASVVAIGISRESSGAARREAEAVLRFLVANTKETRDMGHRTWSISYRSRVVVLRVLAAAVSQRHARIQLGEDCSLRLDPVRCRRCRQLRGRLRFR